MTDDLTTILARMAGGERAKAENAETPFRHGLHEARAETMERAAARIAALEASLAELVAAADNAAWSANIGTMDEAIRKANATLGANK